MTVTVYGIIHMLGRNFVQIFVIKQIAAHSFVWHVPFIQRILICVQSGDLNGELAAFVCETGWFAQTWCVIKASIESQQGLEFDEWHKACQSIKKALAKLAFEGQDWWFC